MFIGFKGIHSRADFPGGSVVKNPSANAGDADSIPESRRSPGGENGNPLYILAWKNPMDRGAWQAIVRRVVKSWRPPSDYHFHSHVYMDGTSTLQLCSVSQSCPTLCDPTDCNLPGFSIHGILQARVLEWVAIPFSRGSS